MSGKLKVGDRVYTKRDVIRGDCLLARIWAKGHIINLESNLTGDKRYFIKLCNGNVLRVSHNDIKLDEGDCNKDSTKGQTPLRINRLLAKIAKDLPPDILSEAESEGRMTGESTGYLLSFLGQVISNPNKWYTIRKNPYGERARVYEMNHLKGMVEMLQLDFIEFRHSDLSVMFKLYEDFNGKYDLYNREVL